MRYILLILILVFFSSSCSWFEDSKPNIILLVIDTLRTDHIHGYGYYRRTTPTIDKFIEGGMRFDAAIASTSWSAPSHTTIITGTDPLRHKVFDFRQRIEEGVVPIAVHLKKAGYSTGLFSTHLALNSSIQGINNGFDHRVILKNEKDAKVLKMARNWAVSASEPYFMHIILMTPHAPYNKHPPFYNKQLFTDMPPGGEKTFPFSDKRYAGIGAIPKSMRLGDHNNAGFYINNYDRGVRLTDELVRRFWTSMEETGLLENTMLLITSDHGEGLGDHDYFAHGNYVYDFLVRVPLILFYPERIEAGGVWSQQVPLVDIVPTILGMARLSIPDSIDGKDLSPWLLTNTRPEKPRYTFSFYRYEDDERYMIRSDSFKLIYDSVKQQEEFYNLSDDPQEYTNLLDNRDQHFPEEPYEEMRPILQAFMKRHRQVPIKGNSISLPVSLDDEVLEEMKALGY